MSKHTEGPWAYEPSSGAIYAADGDVEPVIAGINQDNTSEEQADADGWLIAAAPALLAALEEAKSEMRDWGPDHPAMREIDAAIAKAEPA